MPGFVPQISLRDSSQLPLNEKYRHDRNRSYRRAYSQIAGARFASLREWFHQFENELWDRQIASDFKAGKFNKLIEKARAGFVPQTSLDN
jgi:hypothetical protein